MWAEVKQLWDQGLKSYLNDMWNILDFVTNSLYIATFALKLVAYLLVHNLLSQLILKTCIMFALFLSFCVTLT